MIPITTNQSGEEAFKNIAVTNFYEPGSTFKPIIASAALAAGKWKLDTVYNDKGPSLPMDISLETGMVKAMVLFVC